MPRGVYQRNKPAATRSGPQDPSGDVIYPVEGNPSARPGPLCPQCFEDGWPSDSTSAGCAHGMWIRRVPAPVAPVDF